MLGESNWSCCPRDPPRISGSRKLIDLIDTHIVTPATNSIIHSKCSLRCIKAIAKSLPPIKNFDFVPVCGPITFQNPSPTPIDNSGYKHRTLQRWYVATNRRQHAEKTHVRDSPHVVGHLSTTMGKPVRELAGLFSTLFLL